MSPGCKAKRNLVIFWGFPAKTYSCINFKLETSEGIKVKIEKIIFVSNFPVYLHRDMKLKLLHLSTISF